MITDLFPRILPRHQSNWLTGRLHMKKVIDWWRRLVLLGHVQPDRVTNAHARWNSRSSRLRAENRALLNSILGIAGIPPIPLPTFTPPSPADGHSESPTHSSGGDESLSRPTSSNPQTAPQSDSSSRQSAARNDSSPSPSTPPRQLVAPSTLSPIRRRRSWHQINRMLELESAKKTVTSD